MKTLVGAAVACACLSGCAGLAFMPRATGFIYLDAKTVETVTQNALSTKQGESCAESILGLVTTGDASAATAAKNGGITKIATVDHKYTNVLGVYATACAVVSGE